MNFTETILAAIFEIVTTIVKIIFFPIDAAIDIFVPGLNTAFAAINSVLGVIFQYMAYAVSFSGISAFAVSLIIAYFTFKLTLPINIWIAKLIFKWYRQIRP